MNVVGLDVGFSRHRPTSGVAHVDGTRLKLGHTLSGWSGRERLLGSIEAVDVVAIDAPIVLDGECHGSMSGSTANRMWSRTCCRGFTHRDSAAAVVLGSVRDAQRAVRSAR